MAGRPLGAENKDKPFKEALRMELAAAGPDLKALRQIARNVIEMAMQPDLAALPAVKEIADRLDGKPAQTVDTTLLVGALDDLTTEQKRERAASLAKELGLDAIGPVAGSA